MYQSMIDTDYRSTDNLLVRLLSEVLLFNGFIPSYPVGKINIIHKVSHIHHFSLCVDLPCISKRALLVQILCYVSLSRMEEGR